MLYGLIIRVEVLISLVAELESQNEIFINK